MKIVVLDGHTLNPGDLSWSGVERIGDLVVYERTSPELVVERIGDAEAVFTNKTELSREIFEHCPRLKFVCVLATGYNVVDVAAAKEHGVVVSNIPNLWHRVGGAICHGLAVGTVPPRWYPQPGRSCRRMD